VTTAIYDSGWNVALAPISGAQPRSHPGNGLSDYITRSGVNAPAPQVRAAPDVQRQVTSLLGWSGWSYRELAKVLDTTHPTIKLLASGQATGLSRKPGLRPAIAGLHAVCERIAALVPGDHERLSGYLRTPVGNETVATLAASGRAPAAYLEALRAHANMPDGGFPPAVFPSRPGDATVALHD
jgi:hypothetical protein